MDNRPSDQSTDERPSDQTLTRNEADMPKVDANPPKVPPENVDGSSLMVSHFKTACLEMHMVSPMCLPQRCLPRTGSHWDQV